MHTLLRATLALVLGLAAATLRAGPPGADPPPRRGLAEVGHAQVELRGGFWGPRLKTHHEVTVPHALDCLEKDGHVTNFDKAAAVGKAGGDSPPAKGDSPIFVERKPGQSPGAPSGHRAFDSDLHKAIEGALYSLAHTPDPALRRRVDGILGRILAAQQKDGFLIAYFILRDQDQRWSELRLDHQMYNAGHFFEAAVEHARLMGACGAGVPPAGNAGETPAPQSLNVLNAAKRFADHIDSIFGPGKRYDVDGHQEVELALVKLYRATGVRRYLDLARFFLDERGYAHGTERKPYDPKAVVEPPKPAGPLTKEEEQREKRRARLRIRTGRMQDHKPVIEQQEAVGHAVRAGYMFAAMADMVRFSDAPGYEQALDAVWRDVVEGKMYITGGIGTGQYDDEGFGDPYLLPNNSAYCESCAAIAHVLWAHRMSLLHADARYADVLELALYNAVLSGISLSGDRFFYQNPLASQRGAKRSSWIGLSCCPTNLTRILPQVGGLVYAQTKGRLYVNLYAAGEATVELDCSRHTPCADDSGTRSVPTTRVKLAQETDYPWDGRVRLTVKPDQPSDFTLCLRVPGWARGTPVSSYLYRFGQPWGAWGPIGLTINGQKKEPTWWHGGYIELERRWQAGDIVELDFPMSIQRVVAHEKVKDDEGKVALMRGPIVYCLEAVDNSGQDVLSLRLPRESELRAERRADLLGGVTVIQGKALADGGRAVTMTAVPYYAWANREKGAMTVWVNESIRHTPCADEDDCRTNFPVPPSVGRTFTTAECSGTSWKARPTQHNGTRSVPDTMARRVLSLDGRWDIAEGPMETVPRQFDRKVPVPGLIDMAQPAFAEVGVKSKLRDAFWYRRTFRVEGPLPDVAVLKVHKALYGTRVVLNGTPLGDHLPCFTPGLFDARKALKGENEILIRVGAFRDSVPPQIPAGWDYEKYRFTPGIFDSVELILTGAPHIARVQAVPDIEKKAVTVHVWVQSKAAPDRKVRPVSFLIREARSKEIVGEGRCEVTGTGPERSGQVTIPIRNCHLWSPEAPFLYELEARTFPFYPPVLGTEVRGDTLTTRFGMRTFRLDPATGRAVLNGKPYFMRGSNVTLYRFFEDGERGDKPWREEWVRRLHKTFRDMHWNSLRYCIGFPPEAWYRIADEEGFLIQDEFPIWQMEPKPDLDGDELVREYTEWMQERWNHPCVVIWDACNETARAQTGQAIQKVRGLDLSNRPWDNGWAAPVAPSDCKEEHPYHFINPNFKLAQIAKDPGTLNWKPGKSPIIVNEYGWLWLNRDGTPTTLTQQLYENLLGKDSTTAQRRHLYARYLAAETEFWRSHRACAGVLHFCALGYSRSGDKPRPEGGATSDHWLDVEKLAWEPEFYRYVRDAFAPVGLMIDAWAEEYPAGKQQEFPVIVINDLYEDCRGSVQFKLLRDGKIVSESSRSFEVPALGKQSLAFTIQMSEQPGRYQVEATLTRSGTEPVRSLRDFNIAPKK